MVEPAFGVGGTLTALQAPTPVGVPASGGDLRAAAGDLSRAAAGLESVRGNISGQTMAMNQMAQSQDMRMREIGVSISQLNSSIALLANNINRMASGVGVMGGAAVAQGVGAPTPMMAGGMGPEAATGGGFPGMAARVGMGAARLGAAGIHAAGRGLGNLGGAMISPFVGAQFSPAAEGQFGGQVGNAGGLRSFMLGTGISFRNDMLRQSGAGEVTGFAADRAAMRMGDIGISAGAGALEFGGQLGGALGGGHLGMLGGAALGGAAGTAVAGPVGGAVGGFLGGAGGMLAGSSMGGQLGAGAVRLGTRPVLNQLGAIRGGGEMMGRQAHRFMDPGGLDPGTGMPNSRQRQRMGTSMFQEVVSDLTFGQEDMQEMFGSMTEQDLLRGANNISEVRRLFKLNKEAIKNIGRTMHTTIQESGEIVGELQALGVDVRGSRAVGVLAGTGVRGLTRPEAMRGQQAFAGQFAGTGLQGRGLMELGGLSQQLGQTAIASGAMSTEQVAAAGGRQGVQQVLGQGVAQLLQGDMGMAMMAAGMRGGKFNMADVQGLDMMQTMQQAGSRASAGNLAALTANPQKFMREALKDPEGLTVQLMTQVTSTADMLSRNVPGLARDDAILHVLKGQGMSSVQADGFLTAFKQMPKGMRERAQQQTRALNEQVTSQAMENISITGNVRRFGQRMIAPVSISIAESAAEVQDQVSNLTRDVKDRVLGLRRVSLKTDDANVKALDNMLSGSMKGIGEDRRKVLKAKPSELQKSTARRSVSGVLQDHGGPQGYTLLQKLRDSRDPADRKKYAEQIMQDLGGKSYTEGDDETKKAIEDAVSELTQENVSGALSESVGAAREETMEKISEATDEARRLLTEGSTGEMIGGVAGGAGAVGVGTVMRIAATPLMMALGPVAVLGGAALQVAGGIFGAREGASFGARAGISDEKFTELSRNKKFQKLVKLRAKEARNEKLTTQEQIDLNNMLTDDPDIPQEVRDRVRSMGKEQLGKLDTRLDTIETESAKVGAATALETAAADISQGLTAIGRYSEAGALLLGAGEEGGLTRALEGLSISTEEMEKLRADPRGAGLIRAFEIKSSTSRDEIIARLGGTADAKKMVNDIVKEGEKFTPEAAAKIAAIAGAQANAPEGMAVFTNRGLTQEQREQNSSLKTNISVNTAVLKQLERLIKEKMD